MVGFADLKSNSESPAVETNVLFTKPSEKFTWFFLLDIVAGVETGLRKIQNAASVTIARSKVAEILKTASPQPNQNVTREEEALKELKNKKLLF